MVRHFCFQQGHLLALGFLKYCWVYLLADCERHLKAESNCAPWFLNVTLRFGAFVLKQRFCFVASFCPLSR